MRRFITFIVLSLTCVALIHLIHRLFNLGEVDTLIVVLPVVFMYIGTYGLTIPCVKSKDKE